MRLVYRFFVVLAFGLTTFWPDYGLFWLGLSTFPHQPWAVAFAATIWLVLFCLVLPMSLRTFQIVSSLALLGAMGVLTGAAWAGGYIYVTLQLGIIYATVVFFTVAGWLMIATPIWRSTRGVVAVEQTPDNH